MNMTALRNDIGNIHNILSFVWIGKKHSARTYGAYYL